MFDLTKGGESSPMYPVLLFAGAPVPCQETVPTTDDFCIKVGGELGPILR